MLARADPTTTSIASQSSHLTADPRLDQLVMAAMCRVEIKKWKSGYQGRSRGDGGGKVLTIPTQGGGRGRGGTGQTSQTTRGQEQTISKWKLNNPPFLVPPTDHNNVAFFDEHNDCRFWCDNCAKWGTYIGNRCSRLTTETTAAPAATLKAMLVALHIV